jgi:hypothetical protein
MSGWMKYPYQECRECPVFEKNEIKHNDELDDIVNEPREMCSETNSKKCKGCAEL